MAKNTNRPTRSRFGYPSTSSMLKIFLWHKEKVLPAPLNTGALREKGIPERDLVTIQQTLKDFGLINEDGHPTPKFDQLASAYQTSPKEYQDILHSILHETYSEIFFNLNDPAKATPSQFKAAFESYEPRSEHKKMISLFKGMCREAGLMPPLEGIIRMSNGQFTTAVQSGTSGISQDSNTPRLQEENTPESIGEEKMNGHINLDLDQFMSDGIYKTLQYLRRLRLRLRNHPSWTDEDRRELDEMIEFNLNQLRKAFNNERS